MPQDSPRDHPGRKDVIPKHISPPEIGAVFVGEGHEKSGTTPEPIVLAQLATIARWYCEGVPFNEMGRLLNINKDTVSSRMNKLRAQWQQSIENYNERKSEELAKLDNIEREAWEAWHKSTQERTTTMIEMEPPAPGQDPAVPRPTKQTLKKEQRDGNPAFLEMVFRCIDRRIRLLGMDAPVRIQSDVTLRALASKIAEEEGLALSDVMEEAERIFQATVNTNTNASRKE